MTNEKKKPAPSIKNWLNRIVSYAEESPDQLLANPQNWRVHSRTQQSALSGVLDDIGFIAPVVVNQNTGHLVDGHLRVSLALRHSVPLIPVVYVNLTEDEEREALTTFDPITNMANSDMNMLESLIKDLGKVNESTRLLLGNVVHEANKKALSNLVDPMAGYKGTEEPPDSIAAPAMPSLADSTPGSVMLRSMDNTARNDDDDDDDDDDKELDIFSAGYDFDPENPFGFSGSSKEAQLAAEGKSQDEYGRIIYPVMFSDNDWGIPTLNLQYQVTEIPVLIERWGRIARHGTRMPGMWHFYTDDYKFTGIWRNPDVVIKTGAIAAVEPNFSTGENYAKAEILYNVWQKRWLGAYWQTRGIKIMVDLNYQDTLDDIMMLGVPRGWRSYALRIHNADGYKVEDAVDVYRRAQKHAETEDIVFAVFSTTKRGVPEACEKYGWHLVRPDNLIKGEQSR